MSRTTILAALTAVAAAAGAALAWRRRAGGATRTTTKTGPEPWTCQCGQAFRVSGTGRHAVFWLADADESDPVLGRACPNCERDLPVTL